jgi:hypothetical protein
MASTKVDDNSEINDLRSHTMFRGISFSGFKKTEVKTQMIENMKKGKVEQACYWCTELVGAGHYSDIWEIVLHFFGKHIHLANPKIAIYLSMRYNIFKNIITQGFYTNELQLRNHMQMRRLFAELICNLTLSPKKPGFEPIKIDRKEEFEIQHLVEKASAPSLEYSSSIFMKEDPNELTIALNEFAYQISRDSKNMSAACYWTEWLSEFEVICKTKKQPIRCQRRNYPVEKNFQKDAVWLIWDAILTESERRNNSLVDKIIQSAMEIFCINYTTAANKRRRFLIYFAISLLTEPVVITGEIVTNREVLENVLSHINQLYKQIKENECSPNTEYLFSNIDKENQFEKTIQKLEIMQSLDRR